MSCGLPRVRGPRWLCWGKVVGSAVATGHWARHWVVGWIGMSARALLLNVDIPKDLEEEMQYQKKTGVCG